MIKTLFPAVLTILTLSLTFSCNETKLSGDSRPPAQQPQQPQQRVEQPQPATDNGYSAPVSTPATSQPQQVKADEVVEGMEVINDCNRCVQRAAELSKTLNFVATKDNAVNLHFYKIEPSRNLCDIHFLANKYVEISDHEARDSVLEQQVALYCPCNCGWKEPEVSFVF